MHELTRTNIYVFTISPPILQQYTAHIILADPTLSHYTIKTDLKRVLERGGGGLTLILHGGLLKELNLLKLLLLTLCKNSK